MLWRKTLRLRSSVNSTIHSRRVSTAVSTKVNGSHMLWSTEVISTVSADTEPTILITFDNSKYAFNAGENTGRAWRQTGRPWRGTRSLFLTSIGTQRCSGLPGLVMFLADAFTEMLSIVGPRGLSYYLASERAFLWRDNLYVSPVEIESPAIEDVTRDPVPVYKDENITVYGIHLSPQHLTEGASTAQTSYQVSAEDASSSNKRKRSPSPDSSSKRPQVAQSADDSQRPASDDPSTSLSPSLLKSLNSSLFSPSSLIGDDAKEWIKLTIENMLPKLPPEPLSKKDKKRKAKRAAAASTSDSTAPTNFYGAARHTELARHKERRLPRFIPELSNSSDPTMKQTLCYVVIGPRYRGKFNAAAADALGLQRKDRAKLCANQTVTLQVPDSKGGTIERVIQPSDVIGASETPKVVIVLDVPSPAHIPDLTTAFESNPLYSRLRSKKADDNEEYSVHVIYHMCGQGVLEDPRYKAFMNGFVDSVNHVVASREHAPDPVTFTSVGGIQLKLNKLDSEMFPIPYYRLHAEKTLSSVPDLPPNVTLMQANLTVGCRPPKPLRISEEAPKDYFHPFVTGKEELIMSKRMMGALRRSRSRSRSISPPPGVSKQNPEIVKQPGHDVVVIPLGTSSATPSRYRNVSSTLIRIPGHGSVLLDAGEGTWGQLIRFFGDDPEHKSGVWEVLRDLKCIYMSHVHGDHHIGVAKILAMRNQLKIRPASPVWAVGVHSTLLHLHEVNDLEDLGLDNADGNGVIPVLSDALNWRSPRPYPGIVQFERLPWLDYDKSRAHAKDMCEALGLSEFLAVDVYHKTRCYGSVLKHKDGWSVVFSADTRPVPSLVRAGEGATLLIHEASMGDNEWQAAKDKAHSTFGEAIQIGKEMKAENILLTHFSQRYPRMPEASMLDNTTWAVALDHTKIPIADIPKLRAYIPAIKRCFTEISDEDDDEGGTHNTVAWGD